MRPAWLIRQIELVVMQQRYVSERSVVLGMFYNEPLASTDKPRA